MSVEERARRVKAIWQRITDAIARARSGTP
jgi:hypothetical protein